MSIEKKSAEIVSIEANRNVHHSTRHARIRKANFQDAFHIARLCTHKGMPVSMELIDTLRETPEDFAYVLGVARKWLVTYDPVTEKDGVILLRDELKPKQRPARKKRKAA